MDEVFPPSLHDRLVACDRQDAPLPVPGIVEPILIMEKLNVH